MKASDITDERMIEAVRAAQGLNGVPNWSDLWAIQERLPFPPKVVLAKLKSLVKRGLLTGCCCGCRGDFELKEKQWNASE